jgi:hypothetical protein
MVVELDVYHTRRCQRPGGRRRPQGQASFDRLDENTRVTRLDCRIAAKTPRQPPARRRGSRR